MEYAYKGISVIVGESGIDVRRAIRSALLGNDFKPVIDFSNVDDVIHHLRSYAVDLIIIDKDLPPEGSCGLITDIRNGRLGSDPFMPIILLAGDVTGSSVYEVLSSGVDYIVQRPFAVTDLLARVHDLIVDRKPFVVTQTYIGPNRRSNKRTDTSKDQLIEVPNALRAKALGDKEQLADIAKAQRATMSEVNTLRLQRHAVAIMSKIEDVVKALNDERGAEAYAKLGELSNMMGDIRQRIGTTKYLNSAPICDSLIEKIDALVEQRQVSKKDAVMLWPLAETIAETFSQ